MKIQTEKQLRDSMAHSEEDLAAGRLVSGASIRQRLRASIDDLECQRPWAAVLSRVFSLARAAKTGPQTEEDGFRFGQQSAQVLLDAGFSEVEARDYINRIVLMVAVED